jgi:hypothetical protein
MSPFPSVLAHTANALLSPGILTDGTIHHTGIHEKQSEYVGSSGGRNRDSALINSKDRDGEGGIRTHGGVTPTPVFETGLFNRSSTSPKADGGIYYST